MKLAPECVYGINCTAVCGKCFTSNKISILISNKLWNHLGSVLPSNSTKKCKENYSCWLQYIMYIQHSTYMYSTEHHCRYICTYTYYQLLYMKIVYHNLQLQYITKRQKCHIYKSMSCTIIKTWEMTQIGFNTINIS